MPPGRRKSISYYLKRLKSEGISTKLRLNIFSAAAKNNHQVLRQQLETIHFADILDLKNETPLNVVSKKTESAQSRETAKILLSYGADILWPDYHGSTSAAYFFIRKDPDFIDLVLRMLPNVNVPLDSEENTALHLAVEANVESTVLKLLERGADPNRKNKRGLTPVHKSVTKSGFQFLIHLYSLGGDINLPAPDSQTPLHMASRMGNKDCLEAVLYCNPELNAKDRNGLTPLLILTIRHNHLVPQIYELLRKGADPSVRTPNEDNCLHSLISMASISTLRVTKKIQFYTYPRTGTNR
ncbi:ankyrin repeat and protein kinase domain-containing protein 1-like isoform X2 [Coccinella septempunctata]|uniref:ankyrin repeat and protein kinase domain-containing protein 1-like isoform X2 n=1 Tax=Coccinella septempunctata TaxID=41139 RepID=UPI001D06B154|nr:ankyrin repeat and protein kinase domain-containing protein 1-like isoform X2 [Coccinella septempunctata]